MKKPTILFFEDRLQAFRANQGRPVIDPYTAPWGRVGSKEEKPPEILRYKEVMEGPQDNVGEIICLCGEHIRNFKRYEVKFFTGSGNNMRKGELYYVLNNPRYKLPNRPEWWRCIPCRENMIVQPQTINDSLQVVEDNGDMTGVDVRYTYLDNRVVEKMLYFSTKGVFFHKDKNVYVEYEDHNNYERRRE